MRRFWMLLPLSVLVALPALAEGAEEGGGHAAEGAAGGWTAPVWGVPVIAWQIANLLLVIGLFVYLLRRPAPKFFEGRAQEIQDLLRKAVHDREEATARLREVEAKMEHLKDEVASIELSAREQAEADRQKVQAEAEQARERLKQETTNEITRRVVEARRELRHYAADAAVEAARGILTTGINEADETRLRDRFLSGVTEEVAHERAR